MAQQFRKGIGGRRAAHVAYFAANPDARLCDDCIRGALNYSRSMFTEKDIRESALEAGLVRKIGLCLNCQKERFVIASHSTVLGDGQ